MLIADCWFKNFKFNKYLSQKSSNWKKTENCPETGNPPKKMTYVTTHGVTQLHIIDNDNQEEETINKGVKR